MDNENYTDIKKYILLEILKDRSTIEMSTFLGFKFDKYKRWLNNEKILRWDEFEFICVKTGLDTQHALKDIVIKSNYDDSKNIFTTLTEWNQLGNSNDVAEFLNCHPSVIKRYNSNATVPDLETIVKLIDNKPGLLLAFIKNLFSNNIHHPHLKKWVDSKTDFSDYLKNPIMGCIHCMICLDSYKNKEIDNDQWFAEKLGIPLTEAQLYLNQMIGLGLLEEKNGLYISRNPSFNTEGLSYQDQIPTMEFAAKKYLAYLEKRKNPAYKSPFFPGAGGILTFSANEETMRTINNIILKAFYEIQVLAGEDANASEEVRLLSFQTIGLFK